MVEPQEIERAQNQLLARLAEQEAAGERVAGWKLGMTSGPNRDAFGAGVRPFGYLLSSRLQRSGATLWWDETVGTGSIENELCFQLSQDVTQPVDAASIRPLIAGVAPGFEINQVRLDPGATPTERIADNLSNFGLVVGGLQQIGDAWDQAALKVSQLHNADGVGSVTAAGHIDDHFESLATLANQLLRFDRVLQAGQWVITGAFVRAEQPRTGLWSGDFGELGRVHLRVER